MKLRCLIIDDEPLARKGIEEELKGIDFLEIVGIAENVIQANDLTLSLQPDLIFLDIQMPKLTGFDFLRALTHPPLVIIITAYSEYALEGFNMNVTDYLVKPVAFDRLLRACNKAREFYYYSRTTDSGKSPDYFFIKCGNKFEKIFLRELNIIEAADNYVSLHTESKTYISYLTLKNVEAYLPEVNFIKVHKSFVINAGKIDFVEGNEVSIAGKRIPISRFHKDFLMDQIVNRRLIKRQ
jgi:two-component system, LytTR family, response regulator